MHNLYFNTESCSKFVLLTIKEGQQIIPGALETDCCLTLLLFILQ